MSEPSELIAQARQQAAYLEQVNVSIGAHLLPETIKKAASLINSLATALQEATKERDEMRSRRVGEGEDAIPFFVSLHDLMYPRSCCVACALPEFRHDVWEESQLREAAESKLAEVEGKLSRIREAINHAEFKTRRLNPDEYAVDDIAMQSVWEACHEEDANTAPVAKEVAAILEAPDERTEDVRP